VSTAPTIDLPGRVAAVRDRVVAAGGDPRAVRLVAITKGFDAGVVQEALDAGLEDIGESYVQELVGKATELDERAGDRGPRWHFVGRLQRNKVRKAAPFVSLWHSVDRLAVGAEIARWAPGAAVLAQVNASGEASKAGCEPSMAPALVDGLVDLGLDVRGLMTIAQRLGLGELSMGMSDDLEVAVQEGATMVRVGRDLFGPRPDQAGARD
jgi:PLP dependent protein